MLIVTHDVNTARTVPDNIGLLYRRHLAMFGPREMLLSSQEPVVRQFLNARRQGPIGMAEEKDAAELEAEREEGEEIPPLPPIPPQIGPSSGQPRRTQRPAGQWLKENGVTPPPGSFTGEAGYGEAAAPTAPPATTERPQQRQPREREGGAVTLLSRPRPTPASEEPAPAKKTPAENRTARKTTAKKAAAKKTTAKKAAPRKSTRGRSSRSEGDS
jgi:ABC-type proline/glycine betaine transport system ATPase subunit